jgi:hypothetical protein
MEEIKEEVKIDIEKNTNVKDKRLLNLIPAKKGEIRNPKGGPKLSPEYKKIRKATKQLIQEYTRSLAEALPKISPALISQAIEGNVIAIKEVNDRVIGKVKESIDITTGGRSLRPTPEEEEKAIKALKEL